MNSLCIVELHATVNYVRGVSVSQQYSFDKSLTPATVTRT